MNKYHEPKPRYWTQDSEKELAKEFSLPHDISMQDWAWEVSDSTRLTEFFDGLDLYNDDDDIRFTLIDIIFQSLEESEVDYNRSEIVSELAHYLKRNFSVHEYQIWYWAVFDVESKDHFRISPLMRKIWIEMSNSIETHPS